MDTVEALLTRQDACRVLGVSIATLGRLIARGDLEAFKIGNRVRIAPDALIRYLEGHKFGKESSNVTTDAINNNTSHDAHV